MGSHYAYNVDPYIHMIRQDQHCKNNGIPLSAHFIYLILILYWPDDGYI
jgi:hypothetical protein